MRLTEMGIMLEEVAPGLTADDVQKATEATLIVSPQLKVMQS
jgi:acyl CoA:acetate/3-ketoacid CoA transferase